METPKPKPMKSTALDFAPSPHIVEAMVEHLVLIDSLTPKPKPVAKPKAPYTPKNQPLKDHAGLIALKQNLEKR